MGVEDVHGPPDWDAVDAQRDGVYRARFRCERPSPYVGWLHANGEVVPVRCGAPNKCRYCAYQAVRENMVVTALDAERHGFPRVGMTLTTRDVVSPAVFRRGVERVFDVVRSEHRQAAYLGNIEFTTGKAKRSGGIRRMHEHLLLKGIADAHDYDYLEDEVRHAWATQVGAHVVEVRKLRSAAGATAYLVAHHNKTEQRPPEGWKGKRFRPSRGYFGQPIAGLRTEARVLLQSRRLRRAARRMIEWELLDGAPDELIEDELRASLAEARHHASMITFVRLDRHGGIIHSHNVSAA